MYFDVAHLPFEPSRSLDLAGVRLVPGCPTGRHPLLIDVKVAIRSPRADRGRLPALPASLPGGRLHGTVLAENRDDDRRGSHHPRTCLRRACCCQRPPRASRLSAASRLTACSPSLRPAALRKVLKPGRWTGDWAVPSAHARDRATETYEERSRRGAFADRPTGSVTSGAWIQPEDLADVGAVAAGGITRGRVCAGPGRSGR